MVVGVSRGSCEGVWEEGSDGALGVSDGLGIDEGEVYATLITLNWVYFIFLSC